MQTIEYEGFNAIVTGKATSDNYSGELRYIGFAGNTTSARAVAAALLDGANRKNGAEIYLDGKTSVHLERNAKYKVFNTQAKNRSGHGVTMWVHLVNTSMTTQNTDAEELLFLLPEDYDPDTPPEGFFARLKLAVKIPMLPEWETWLWNDGREGVRSSTPETGYSYRPGRRSMRVRAGKATPVREYTAEGAQLWVVSNSQQVWVDVIRDHFDLGQKIGKVARDLHEGGPFRLENDGSVWHIWYKDEQLKDEEDNPHHSSNLAEAAAIAELVTGERLIMEGE